MGEKIRVGVIGFGGMGRWTAQVLTEDDEWDLVAIADVAEPVRARAAETYPDAAIYADAEEIFTDDSIDVVALTTLANHRPAQIRRALATGKHVWAEKPIGATIEDEEALLEEIDASDCHVAVNMFNRNAWYHDQMQAFIAAGEIGDVVAVRVRHQTPGLLPGQGHGPEGAPFHDCGMHYVDVARWYAGSEFTTWDAQGLRFWGDDEPWWVQAQGYFANGVVFSITQGFIHTQLADRPCNSCGLEVIGTKGAMLMNHDMNMVTLDLRGVTHTVQEEGPYGGKKLDVMAKRLAEVIRGGPCRYPTARDSVIASRVSWDMLATAKAGASQFETGTVQGVLDHREHLKKKRELA